MIYNAMIGFAMLGFMLILFWTPYNYSVGLVKIAFGQLYKEDRVKCMIPVYNTIYAENVYTGKFSKIAVGWITLVSTLLFRLLVVLVLYRVSALQYVSLFMFYAGVLVFVITNIIAVFEVLHDSGVVNIGTTILMSIFFPIGQYYIGYYLPGVVANIQKKKSVFK